MNKESFDTICFLFMVVRRCRWEASLRRKLKLTENDRACATLGKSPAFSLDGSIGSVLLPWRLMRTFYYVVRAVSKGAAFCESWLLVFEIRGQQKFSQSAKTNHLRHILGRQKEGATFKDQ